MQEECIIKDIGVGIRSTNRNGWKEFSELLKFMFASVLIVPIAFGQIALTTAQIAKRVSPSVVVIQGKTDAGDILGSGFIVSKDGKIVTNLHVIRDMKTAKVHLAKGETFDSVTVLAIDERRDLAIVKVVGVDLPVLELGNSDSLTVGEPVVAVGSPLGLEATVTAGIISAVRDNGDDFKILQTDAAVNHGNSGGPLVNNKGQAIGVVSSIVRSDSAQGLNFAIPINYVHGLSNNLHEAMTFDQMRRTLSGTAMPEKTGSRSLKQTLDRLKETIPSATHSFSAMVGDHPPVSVNGKILHMTMTTVPISFQSCTVVLDDITTGVPAGHPEIPPLVVTTRSHIPLGALKDVTVSRIQSTKDFIDGQQYVWAVFLETSSDVILLERFGTDATRLGEGRYEHSTFLDFTEQAIAQRVADDFRHAAELCRGIGSTSAVPAPEFNSSNPPLKETLDWLKGNIPLAAVAFIISDNGLTISMNEHSAVFSLDSCTGMLDRVLTLAMVDSPHLQDVLSWRYTVPLGVLAEGEVVHLENIDVPGETFISGEKWAYRVLLKSKSNNITLAAFSPNSKIPVTTTTSNLFLKFNDESIAKRVLAAFMHAADLCRGKEPF